MYHLLYETTNFLFEGDRANKVCNLGRDWHKAASVMMAALNINQINPGSIDIEHINPGFHEEFLQKILHF